MQMCDLCLKLLVMRYKRTGREKLRFSRARLLFGSIRPRTNVPGILNLGQSLCFTSPMPSTAAESSLTLPTR